MLVWTASPRRPFVRSHRFEVADSRNNAFRCSTSNASAAAAIGHAWCMSYVVVYIVPQREEHPPSNLLIHRIGVGSIRRVEEKKTSCHIHLVEMEEKD